MTLQRCSCCVMPDTRPETAWVDGECSACINHRRRPAIDWEHRHQQLVELLDRFDGRVLVPSSGGKDSTAQVMALLRMGADVTVVTARTCFLTDLGRANIDNLARHARTIEVVPNMTVRAKLNRLGLELVGDISHPEHMAIFSVPFRVAKETGHGLIMYGENPQSQWGGPLGTEDARQMTKRWVHQFGGLLGLRADDFVGMEGITDRDMDDYRLPADVDGIEAHFLGQYRQWSSRQNAEVAVSAGMKIPNNPPCLANFWNAENLDSAMTGLHDYFAWLKYGISRGCVQISSDIREGHITRGRALAWVESTQASFPHWYLGVHWHEVMDRIGMTVPQFKEVQRKFTNEAIHGRA